MAASIISPIRLGVEIEHWPLTEPFRITGHTYYFRDFVVVTLESNGCVGRGECAGVRYRGETAQSITSQLEQIRSLIEKGVSRSQLQGILPPGGARNALDCALWDLEARLTRQAVWQIAGVPHPAPKRSLVTCGADLPEKMAEAALGYSFAKALKLKLTGEPVDAARVQAVRAARPDAWISVDANKGYSPDTITELLPTLIDAGVQVIEQPFPAADDALLDLFDSPIAIAADESVQNIDDLALLHRRFTWVNVKLDKCGGLSAALSLVRACHNASLQTWIGNMFGTSLAMAPAFVVGQLCDLVELDGPLFLTGDRPDRIRYDDGLVDCLEVDWGGNGAPGA